MTSRRGHWESIYNDRDHELVGWYQSDPGRSLRLIEASTFDAAAPIVNIGGGSSVLVDRLLDADYTDVTVLDLSATALALAQERLGRRTDAVHWIEGDVIEHDFDRVYAVWHDRAAFHFLIDPDNQQQYVQQMTKALAVGGHAIIATFGLDGPDICSGLPAQRYGPESLSSCLGSEFEPLRFEQETHQTPGGVTQEFLYGHFRKVLPMHRNAVPL